MSVSSNEVSSSSFFTETKLQETRLNKRADFCFFGVNLSDSTGAPVLNTSTPLTPTYGSPPGGYGSSPPAGYGTSPPLYGSMSPPEYGDSISEAVTAPGSRKKTILSLATCLLIATLAG